MIAPHPFCGSPFQAACIFLLLALTAAAQFTPAPGSPFPVEGSPASIAEFIMNGVPYLAVANRGSGDVTILMGNGNGGFTMAQLVNVGNQPDSIAAITLKNGAIVLAVANLLDNNVTVLLSNSSGQFTQNGNPIPVGMNPSFIAPADFNNDQKMDLAVANSGSNNITILLGDGMGGFQPAGSAVGSGGIFPISLAAADFNGDGFKDLAVANLDSNNITILLGGAGGFTSPPATVQLIPNAPAGAQLFPAFLATADFNGDRIPDLVVANEGVNNIAVLLGNGSGGFTPATNSPFAVGSEPVALAIADFNSDGNQDIAVANYSSGNVTVLLGNGAAGFTQLAGSPFSVGTQPHSIAVGAFTQSAQVDLAVANQGSNTVSVLLNTIYAPLTVSAASGTSPVAPGEIVSIFGSNFTATAASASSLPPPVTLGGVSVTIADSSGMQTPLPLLYAGPTQINAQIPVTVATGAATLTVFTATGNQSGPVTLTSIAPSLFSANENGMGVALAQVLTNSPTGFQTVTNVFQCPGAAGTCVPMPVVVSGGNAQLVLYGTGFHNASNTNLTVKVGSATLTPAYVGPAAMSSVYFGEDQVTVTLPATLAGSGLMGVSVTAGGITSNVVTVYFQ